MRTINAKDKVEKRVKRLKEVIIYFHNSSLLTNDYTKKELWKKYPLAISIEWFKNWKEGDKWGRSKNRQGHKSTKTNEEDNELFR